MAPLLSILFWAFLHSCLRFLVSRVLLLALSCISVVLHRITGPNSQLGRWDLPGSWQYFPSAGHFWSGHFLWFLQTKQWQSRNLWFPESPAEWPVREFVSLLDVIETPRITFFKSPISGAEKALCAVLNSSVISGKWEKRDWPGSYLPKPSVVRQFQNILSLLLQR